MLPEAGAEWLDVVDAHDRVVGSAPRALVHRFGLRHRAVHILVCDPAGSIYVQQRAWTKDCQPGQWDTSAAGHVDCGESYAAAAQRELGEELGLHGLPLEALGEFPATPASGYEFVQVYRCSTEREPRPDADEIAQAGWWTPAALGAWIAAEPACFTAVFRRIHARFIAGGAA